MRIDTVTREDVHVLCASEPGTPDAIGEAAGRAFERLEHAIPPRGRTLYGYWDPGERVYFACYALVESDRPEELGLERRVLPGGDYGRVRLRGEDVFAEIGPTFELLAEDETYEAATGRPWFEHYRRHDEVDLFALLAGRPG